MNKKKASRVITLITVITLFLAISLSPLLQLTAESKDVNSFSVDCVSSSDSLSEENATDTPERGPDGIDDLLDEASLGGFHVYGQEAIVSDSTLPTLPVHSGTTTVLSTTATTVVQNTTEPLLSESLYFFEVDGYVSASAQKLLYSYWLKTPAAIRNKFIAGGWTLIITSYDIKEKYVPNSPLKAIAGRTQYTTKEVIIDSEKKRIKYSLLHEMGHFLDWSMGFVTRGKDDTGFAKIYLEEKRNKAFVGVEAYHYSTCPEYFAEAFQQYIKYPATLKKKAPRTYAFMDYCVKNLTPPRPTTTTTQPSSTTSETSEPVVSSTTTTSETTVSSEPVSTVVPTESTTTAPTTVAETTTVTKATALTTVVFGTEPTSTTVSESLENVI